MNPLTQIKNTQKATAAEIRLGLSDSASWHDRFKHSAYIFVGGLDYELTEGDILAVFAQYGEVVDVNLVRDKATGKSRGFAFAAYEDQRSTVLAVDNLSGSKVAGRTIRVEHVDNYKRKKAEMDGLDPDAVEAEEAAAAAAAAAARGDQPDADTGQPGRGQSPGPHASPSAGGQGRGSGAGDAWQAGGSMAALLAEGARLRQQQEAARAAAKKELEEAGKKHKDKKEKKAKKEKKEKKDKKRKRSESSSDEEGGAGRGGLHGRPEVREGTFARDTGSGPRDSGARLARDAGRESAMGSEQWDRGARRDFGDDRPHGAAHDSRQRDMRRDHGERGGWEAEQRDREGRRDDRRNGYDSRHDGYDDRHEQQRQRDGRYGREHDARHRDEDRPQRR